MTTKNLGFIEKKSQAMIMSKTTRFFQCLQCHPIYMQYLFMNCKQQCTTFLQIIIQHAWAPSENCPLTGDFSIFSLC